MWLKNPNALLDGLIGAWACVTVLGAILIISSASHEERQLVPLCQEVIVDSEKDGNILARCPAGTYIEIDGEGNFICRCGRRPMPSVKQQTLMFDDPMSFDPQFKEAGKSIFNDD